MSHINTYSPDYVIHPGEYLEEIIESRELKKGDLAKRCGLSDKQISQILGKHAAISSHTALAFEKALGISASVWNNLNAQYQLFQAKQAEKFKIEEHKEWMNKFPIKEMQKRKIIRETKDNSVIVNDLLTFFRVSSIDIWNDYYTKKAVNYRKSRAYSENLYATMTWLRLGEIQAEKIETRPFNTSLFKKNLSKIRTLTRENPDVFEPAMISLCAEAGAALAFVPEFKKTHLSGATEWLPKNKALIVLSLRHKSDDHFWFSFFHEAGHILLHGKKEIYIDYAKKEHDIKEKEADKFACNILIPEKEYKKFIEENKPDFYEQTITRFGEEQGIAPGIITGMLQHEGLIDYKWQNTLKRKFVFLEEIEA
jgi:HTH-type transcriptional regulator/antitoxin HigA